MRVQVFQHVPFEGIGSIGHWLERRRASIAFTRFFRGDALPGVGAYDWLIVMGGPMSVNDETRHPWLPGEKRAIAEAIAEGRRVLGVCLGAQLVASALGARVFPNRKKEIGWFPVRHTRDAARATAAAAIPDASIVFHWHGDTFELPRGAVGFLSSDGCRNQAFQLGARVVGIQFHLEVTEESTRALVENCHGELVVDTWIQDAGAITGPPPGRFVAIHGLMDDLLEAMAAED